jgi:hypothetical protein
MAQQVYLTGKKEDNDPPQVTITPDTANVPRDAVITVTFSEPVRLRGGAELNHENVDTLFTFFSNGGYGDAIPYNATVATGRMQIVLVLRVWPLNLVRMISFINCHPHRDKRFLIYAYIV